MRFIVVASCGSVDEQPVVSHSSSVMVTHAFEVGKTSSCRKTAAANGSYEPYDHGESNSFAQKVFTFGAKNQDIDGVL